MGWKVVTESSSKEEIHDRREICDEMSCDQRKHDRRHALLKSTSQVIVGKKSAKIHMFFSE